MNFYKHFIGDYARATGHLSLVEHGVYRLMLDHFYGTGRPLPSDRKALYRLLRAESTTERQAVDAVSLRYWRTVPDLPVLLDLLALHGNDEQLALRRVAQEWDDPNGLVNLRALAEIVKAAIQAEKNRQIAVLREQKKRLSLVAKGGA